MAYPYVFRNRMIQPEVYCFDGSDTLVAASNTYTHDVNLPPGVWECGMAVRASGFDANATINVAPYVDPAQSTLGTKYDLGYGNVSGQTVTLTATSATDGEVATINVGDFSAGGPAISIFGFRITINCTATSGTFNYAVAAQPA